MPLSLLLALLLIILFYVSGVPQPSPQPGSCTDNETSRVTLEPCQSEGEERCRLRYASLAGLGMLSRHDVWVAGYRDFEKRV